MPVPQVLRWSALGFGVFYGAYHQLSLSAADKAKAAQKEWERKERLIQEAKQQWARDHPSQQPRASTGGTSMHSFTHCATPLRHPRTTC